MAAFAAALTGAVPVIQKIVSAIWPSGDKSKKTKTDAASAPGVAALKQSSSEAMQSVSDQLTAVHSILEYCFLAQDDVVSMRAVLSASHNGSLSDDDKSSLEGWWGDAKKKINKIGDKDNLKAVKSIEDTYTRTVFTKVIDANTDGIDQDMKKWSLTRLQNKLDKLGEDLSAVNDVAVQTIEGIAEGLAKLSAAQKKPETTDKKAKDN